jgi:uncharacterized RDD family membrane protein YckC
MHADDILDAPIRPAQEPLVFIPGRERVIAGVADFLLLKGIGFALPWVLIHMPYGYALNLFVTAALEVIFYLILVKYHGATPGKMFLNMKIVTTDGTPLTWYHACMRSLPLLSIRLFTLIFFFWEQITLPGKLLIPANIWLLPTMLTLAWYVVSTILVVTNPKRRSLNDLVGGTVVVPRKKS